MKIQYEGKEIEIEEDSHVFISKGGQDDQFHEWDDLSDPVKAEYIRFRDAVEQMSEAHLGV